MASAQSDRANSGEAGFEKIFEAHYGRVFGIVARMAGHGAQAEELASEVFWKLYRQPASAAAWSNVEGWLYKTATHLAIDAARAASRRKRAESAAGAEQERQTSPAGPLQDVLRDEQQRRVRAVLAAMKPAQAQLLLLRSSGCSYKEIAASLEVAPGGIGSMLNRAEAEFRKRYTKVNGGREKA